MLEAAHKLLAAELKCGWIQLPQKMQVPTAEAIAGGDTAGQLRLL